MRPISFFAGGWLSVGLSQQEFQDRKAIRPTPVVHERATVFLGGGDVGMTQEHLLRVEWCFGST